MNCPNCGTQNGVGAKFCQECASALAMACPNCGTPANPGAKFCSNCAAPLATNGAAGVAAPVVQPATAENGSAAAAGSGAELRLVSVLFADLVGFTPFAEERDAEDVRDTLTRYFDLARDVIGRHGGTVEKFIGDAVMAVWGAPVAYEDDAERAVRTALELVEAVQSLGGGIQARAGVLTGEAAVTLGATNQGMVAGDIVNTASRLQSVASPGTVLVGESTQRAASKAIAFEPAGEQTLKGKETPVAAWRALRVVAEIGGRNRAEALEAPFVGRHEEMRLLKDLLHTTEREKRLRVVSVIGPGGIGKSRLAWELLKYIDGLIDNIYWHSGRSPAYGEGISFWALGEMVRERAGLAERDDEATTRQRITETVEQWVADPQERTWIQGALLTLLGVESGLAGDQLFAAWRTFFERISTQGPVVLVFEDMHYADTGLLDFIDHLLEWSRGFPIYVVTLARPDLIDRRPDWGAGKRNFVSMYLEPLTEPQMRELLAGLVPGLPNSAVATIVARADGIPLYAVETVRTLLAEGRLVEEDGKYVPHGDLTTLAVPETLTALIASRLDTLDETDRRIVHDAAVLGQSFTLAALAAVAQMPEADLEPRLASLVRRELLQRQMDPRSPERGQYAFVQALIREVAYNTLAKKDRKRLHLAAARYFESLGNDEIAGALAAHYLAAHASAGEGAEADALGSQARIALKAAATRAEALGSFLHAKTFYEQALSVTTDAKERGDLMELAAEAANTAGHTGEAEGLFRQAMAIRVELGDRAGEARTIGRVGGMLNNQMHPQEAIELLEPAHERLRDVEDEHAMAYFKTAYASVLASLHRTDEAMRLTEEVLVASERSGNIEMLMRGLLSKSIYLLAQKRRVEALGLARTALALAEEKGDTFYQLRALSNIGLMEQDVHHGRAHQINLDSAALARRSGHRVMLLGFAVNIAYAGFITGDWDVGLEAVDGLLQDEDLGQQDVLTLLNNSIILHAARGDDTSAAMARLVASTEGMSGSAYQAFLNDPMANIALAKGDFAEARRQYMLVYEFDSSQVPEYAYRAAVMASWLGDTSAVREPIEAFEAYGGSGNVLAARQSAIAGIKAALEGRMTEAMPHFRDALSGFRSLSGVWDEALTGVTMARLLDPNEPEVAEVIRSTREILERLKARPLLEQLDAVLAAKPSAKVQAAPRAQAAAEVQTA